MSNDPQAKATDILADANKAQVGVARRLESLERRFEIHEVTLNSRMEHLEREMGTSNAHLDNLVREAQITNKLLGNAEDDRRVESERRQRLEDEDRLHQRELALDKRETMKGVGAELWAIFKQPLGFLVGGAVAWLLYEHFAVPANTLVDIGAPTTSAP